MSQRVITAVDEMLAFALQRTEHDFDITVADPRNIRALIKLVRAAEEETDTVLVIGSSGWDPLPIVEKLHANPTKVSVVALVPARTDAVDQRACDADVYSVLPMKSLRRRIQAIEAECCLAHYKLQLLRAEQRRRAAFPSGTTFIVPSSPSALRKKARAADVLSPVGGWKRKAVKR